ncbi:MAG TPA: pyridoxamine 5'-phosphate oxidase family protein [Actinomycetota bacterium]|nr:pyridoxamine 5'-phosphate oxidase family protein [Actinomycetota bacterium]
MSQAVRRHPRPRRHPGRAAARQPTPQGWWWSDRRVREVLDDGDLTYLAVRSPRGPHVTPLAFGRQAGRLWLVTSRDSLKVRAISRDPAVGGLVRSGQRSVMWSGRARLVDPLTARGLGTNLLQLPLAVTGYIVRNFREAAGVVWDRPVPTLPITKLLITVDLDCVALLQGWSVVAAWGPWSRQDLLGRGTPPRRLPPPLRAIPPALRQLLLEPDRPAVLGWQTASGPMAIPAVWDQEQATAVASADAMVLAGASPRGPGCLTVGRGECHADAREGLLLRGSGTASQGAPGERVALDVRTITYWTGTRTRTIDLRTGHPPRRIRSGREARHGRA